MNVKQHFKSKSQDKTEIALRIFEILQIRPTLNMNIVEELGDKFQIIFMEYQWSYIPQIY